MTDAISIALSGANAATTRVHASASNIANAQTPNYRPVDVVQTNQTATSGEPQGTEVNFTPRTPAFVQTYAPDAPGADKNGFINSPNVDLTTETVSITQAVSAYKANLAVVSVASDMSEALLNSFA